MGIGFHKVEVAQSAASSRCLLCLLVLAGLQAISAEVEHCYTFYNESHMGNGSVMCPSRCPYRTTCLKDRERSTCIESRACRELLPKGQVINASIEADDGVVIPNRTCQSCNLPSCKQCSHGINGSIVCLACNDYFSLDASGSCVWTERTWNTCFIVVLSILAALVLWILADLLRATLVPTTNSSAIERGFLLRRRAKLLCVSDGKHRQCKCKPSARPETHICQHSLYAARLFGKRSRELAGPGHSLFMSWYPFVIAISCWMAVGAALFAPSDDEIDPCKHQVSTGDGGLAFRDSNLKDKQLWTVWNYFGCSVLFGVFLAHQSRLYEGMVKDKDRPEIHEFCVELSEVPTDLTSHEEITRGLSDWMRDLGLSPDGIRYVSVAYNIPDKDRRSIEKMLDDHLRDVAGAAREEEVAEESHPHLAALKTSQSSEHSRNRLNAGPFWIQLIAGVLLGTPLELRKRGHTARALVVPEMAPVEGASQLLGRLQGSGYVYVVLQTEAQAHALAGMGTARLLGLPPMSVRPAGKNPSLIRWFDHSDKNQTWLALVGHIVRISVLLTLVMIVWLGLFGWYLTFELVTLGVENYSKTFIGTFVVGLLVPLGNEMFSAIVDSETEGLGFRNHERLELLRLSLKVPLNWAAQAGEVYLIYKKVFSPHGWAFTDVPFEIWEWLRQISGHVNEPEFQINIQSIVVPAGFFVPLLIAPFMANVLPCWVGQLRLKRDQRLNAAHAERILKPSPVDLKSGYIDMLSNSSLIAMSAWLSKGRYLIVLWLAFCGWAILHCLIHRLNLLRWQARFYYTGQDMHQLCAMLLCMPAGLMAADFGEACVGFGSGPWLFLLGVCYHLIFVQFLVKWFTPRPASSGRKYDELIQADAPLADYQNVNPIEVLKQVHHLSPSTTPLVYYRDDKWYLQRAAFGNRLWNLPFEGETVLDPSFAGTLKEQLADIKEVVSSTRKDLRTSAHQMAATVANATEIGVSRSSRPEEIQ